MAETCIDGGICHFAKWKTPCKSFCTIINAKSDNFATVLRAASMGSPGAKEILERINRASGH